MSLNSSRITNPHLRCSQAILRKSLAQVFHGTPPSRVEQPANHVLSVLAASSCALIREPPSSVWVLCAAESPGEAARECAYAVAAFQPRTLLHQLEGLLTILGNTFPAIREDPSEVSARGQMAERDGFCLLLSCRRNIAGCSEAFGLV